MRLNEIMMLDSELEVESSPKISDKSESFRLQVNDVCLDRFIPTRNMDVEEKPQLQFEHEQEVLKF